MSNFLLASASLARRQLLQKTGITFDSASIDLDESLLDGENAMDATSRLARLKLNSAISKYGDSYDYILSADSLVQLNDRPCGKMDNLVDLVNTLNSYSDSSHIIYTSIAFYTRNKSPIYQTVATTLWVKKLDKSDIDWYIDQNDWYGVAGGYKIQGAFACFVSKIDGSYTNIEGLPMELVYNILKDCDLV